MNPRTVPSSPIATRVQPSGFSSSLWNIVCVQGWLNAASSMRCTAGTSADVMSRRLSVRTSVTPHSSPVTARDRSPITARERSPITPRRVAHTEDVLVCVRSAYVEGHHRLGRPERAGGAILRPCVGPPTADQLGQNGSDMGTRAHVSGLGQPILPGDKAARPDVECERGRPRGPPQLGRVGEGRPEVWPSSTGAATSPLDTRAQIFAPNVSGVTAS